MVMKNPTATEKRQNVKRLKIQVKKLRTKLEVANNIAINNEALSVSIRKSQKHFKRVRDPEGPDVGIGEFLFYVHVTAVAETVYIPISIASGKKPTGFVYQIEGTAKGAIATTDITCKGVGVTQITLGTIVYAKIPFGATAIFRIHVEIRGQIGKEYHIAINRIHFKRDIQDVRYEKFLKEISTRSLKFR